jgi:hypothetical protein
MLDRLRKKKPQMNWHSIFLAKVIPLQRIKHNKPKGGRPFYAKRLKRDKNKNKEADS